MVPFGYMLLRGCYLGAGPRTICTRLSVRMWRAKAALTSCGGELRHTFGCADGLVERKPDARARKHAAGNRLLARFAERNLPQQQRLGLMQLGGGDVSVRIWFRSRSISCRAFETFSGSQP